VFDLWSCMGGQCSNCGPVWEGSVSTVVLEVRSGLGICSVSGCDL
jgi:hypothetical protein